MLKALTEYYLRKSKDPDAALAPEGFELKEISFEVVLHPDGTLAAIEDVRYIPEGKKFKQGKQRLIPKRVDRSVNVLPNLLVDNLEYVLGIPGFKDGKSDEQLKERAATVHTAFKSAFHQCFGSHLHIPALAAIQKFFETFDPDSLLSHPLLEEWVKTKPWFGFRILGEAQLVGEQSEIMAIVSCSQSEDQGQEENTPRRCLITGEMTPPARLHSPIQGVKGAKTTGAKLVSFNDSSHESDGAIKGDNAPVSQTAMFHYTTALNHLLSKGSKQKMDFGHKESAYTIVFWASEKNDLEETFGSFLVGDSYSDPDADTGAVSALYHSIYSGQFTEKNADGTVYILGLTPNDARIAVKYWKETTLVDLGSKIQSYFQDLSLENNWKEDHRLFPSIRSLLRSLIPTNRGKDSERDKLIQTRLIGDFLQSILDGTRFPRVLLQNAVSRAKLESTNKDSRDAWERTSLIKACLNRENRIKNNTKEILQMSLDTTNINTGYLLGRLFAILEKVQYDGNKTMNASIRDKFLSSASTTPSAAFPSLMRLFPHHLKKLSNHSHRIFYDKKVSEIMDHLKNAFPKILGMDDQGQFHVGYFQQKNDLFRSKQEKVDSQDIQN